MAKKAIRPIRIEGNVAYVTLTKGYEAIIDAADVWLAEGHNWHAVLSRKTVYAARTSDVEAGGKRSTIMLHRLIAAPPDTLFVDHIDGDGLNNRRTNLRIVTNSQNQQNRKFNSGNKSGFKGVFLDRKRGQWVAQIKANGQTIYLGRFHALAEAADARAKASANLHGDFGCHYAEAADLSQRETGP